MSDEATMKKRRGARGPYLKSEATKEAILEAALQVFANQGYRKASLRTIANIVGMSQAGMLRHFATKEVLLAEVLIRNDNLQVDGFVHPTEGKAILRDLIDRVERDISRPGVVELYCILTAEASDPDHPAREYFVQRYAGLVKALTAALETLRGTGELRSGVDPEEGARALLAQMDGIRLQWLLEPSKVDIVGAIRSFCGTYLLEETSTL